MTDRTDGKKYNPDVLSCLANLSNDEVFTPPRVVNEMLDLLPKELFRSPETTFLDPACKSGVFLREIARRLIEGLAEKIPNLQKRVDHILHHQVYGIAITELTSLVSRRTLYCSKYPQGRFSVSAFDSAEGNIRFRSIRHTWKDGKCVWCGASESTYSRENGLETHAYEFIHQNDPEKFFDMKFDVIIGNPPYQLETDGAGKQAIPLYHLFVEQAKKLKPRYLTMIIQSRWFAGGMKCLEGFRKTMLEDKQLVTLVDYANAKDCFPQNSIGGGVCYFLWARGRKGSCKITNISSGDQITMTRYLDEFPVLVRYNNAVSVLRKIKEKKESSLDSIASSLSPFGLPTNYRGSKSKSAIDSLSVHTSDGVYYASREIVNKGLEYMNKYKVLVSKTSSEHAGEPGKDGMFRVLTNSLKVLGPGEVCTHSYFVIGKFDTESEATNLLMYLKTRFARFLILMSMSSINLSKSVLQFVPVQNFKETWTDDKLYTKYRLGDKEVSFIESMIKPMEAEG